MSLDFLIFSFSLMFLITSANFLLRFIEKFSGKVKISPLVIGATIIAVGTSLPETFVAVSSIAQNAIDISFGDVVGSNIANISLITGLAILLFPVRIGTQKTQRNNLIMILVTVVFIILAFVPYGIRKALGAFLIFFYTVFLATEIVWGENGKNHEDRKALAKLATRDGTPLGYLLGILASLAVLLISSRFLVTSVISISKVFGISEQIIGLSIVAVGTSLPELAATIISGIDKDWKLLFGDLQGSNIYNLAVIGSILFIAANASFRMPVFPLIILAVSTFSITLLCRKYEGTNIPRAYGLLYLALYGYYVWSIYKPLTG